MKFGIIGAGMIANFHAKALEAMEGGELHSVYGRSPEKAAVAATTGLMQMLNREELAGVMAHELAHIKNRDTLIMTISATVAGAISMLAQFGFLFRGGRNNAMGLIGSLLAIFLAPMAAAT